MIGDLENCPTVLLKLAQNWVICIEKGGPNSFAQVTTNFGNLCWNYCLLIKNNNEICVIESFLGRNLIFRITFFTWCLEKDHNISKKEKYFINLINNTIN